MRKTNYNEAAVAAMNEAITFLTIAFNMAKALRDVDRIIGGYTNGEAYWSLVDATDDLRNNIEAYVSPLTARVDRVHKKLVKNKLHWCKEFDCFWEANSIRQPMLELFFWVGIAQTDYIWKD